MVSTDPPDLVESSTFGSVSKRIARYLTAGGLSALAEIGIFRLVYEATSGAVHVANPVTVILATALNFSLNRSWTFASRGNLARSASLYIMLFLFNLGFTTTAIWLLDGSGVDALLAKIGTMALVTTWNFFLYREFVFRS